MASGTRELTLKLVAQTADMQKGIAGVDDKLGGFQKGLNKIGGAMAGAFAVEQVISFGKSVLDEASNIAESTSKIGEVFGKSASKSIIKFGKDANKAMGLADEEALNYLGTLGAMWTGLGKTQEESADMSKATMTLAADLGSFNNVSTPETLDMMSAAFRGEYDSIQRMLPGLNAASVEQEALAQTGKKSAKELTQQEKAMATLSLMTKQAGPAIGDFARTSSGAANQQKILASQIEDAKAALGEKLLPAFAATLNFITDKVVPGIEWFIGWMGGPFVDGLTNAWNFVYQYIGPVIDNISGLVWGLWQVLENFVGLVINVFTGDWRGAWDSVTKIFSGAWEMIKRIALLGWQAIQAIWNGVIIGLKWLGGLVLDVITWPFRTAWDIVKFFSNAIWQAIQTAWDGMLNWVKGTGNAIYDALTWPFKSAWEFIKRTWNSTLGKVSFTVPGWIPGIGGKEFKFPQLAKGGIVTRPTLALVGEAGPEAVVPLGKAGFGGNVYNIHVNTGVGDPVSIGQQVAKALQDYERVSGPRRSGARGGL